MQLKFLFAGILMLSATQFVAQRVGINTDNPQRVFEVADPTNVYLRLNSTDDLNGAAGIEFLRSGALNGEDWRIRNDNGDFKIESSTNNLASAQTKLKITPDGNTGIGVDVPQALLHLAHVSDASNTTHGSFILGNISGLNITMDSDEILARNNGGPSTLHIQPEGGNTTFGIGGGYVGIGTAGPQTLLHVLGFQEASNTNHGIAVFGTTSGLNMTIDANEILARNNGNASTLYIQHAGGNTVMGANGGAVNVGNTITGGKLNIEDDLWQLHLNNPVGPDNDWYIGASNSGWLTGGNSLVFSPTNSSAAGILRLYDVTDNNGTNAPMVIATNGGEQQLLMDGNEIDALSPLYINHNTNSNTYINPSGGLVGIGTTNPDEGILHVTTPNSTPALALEHTSGSTWTFRPHQNTDLYITRAELGQNLASIDGASGAWQALSDARAKENIRDMPDMTELVRDINLYSYNYIHDADKKETYGVIAQEIKELFPHMVNECDGYYTVQYSQLSVIALKAIQERQEIIQDLTVRIEKLENK